LATDDKEGWTKQQILTKVIEDCNLATVNTNKDKEKFERNQAFNFNYLAKID